MPMKLKTSLITFFFRLFLFFVLVSVLGCRREEGLVILLQQPPKDCMDTAQWPQEIGLVKPMEGMTCSRPASMERRTRPQKEQALSCPRCNSTNTKFCYYNNYSLTQPRYFCKTCRRYWTEGGSLRNVPVGGGSRKNKRSSSSASSNSASSALTNSSKKMPELITQPNSSQNPKIHQAQDLNLAFQTSQEHHHMSDQFVELPGIDNSSNPNSSTAITSSFTSLSALELLRSGIASRGMNSFVPMPGPEARAGYPAGYGMHELRPSLNFSLDGFGGPYGSVQGGGQEASGRLLFPFEDLKPVLNTDFEQENRGGHGDSSGYWNGMLGGGSW